MIRIAQRNFENLLAMSAGREGKFAVAPSVIASDERWTRLEAMHHAQLHQLIKSPIDGWGMGNTGRPYSVKDRVGAKWFCGRAQTRKDLGLIPRKLF